MCMKHYINISIFTLLCLISTVSIKAQYQQNSMTTFKYSYDYTSNPIINTSNNSTINENHFWYQEELLIANASIMALAEESTPFTNASQTDQNFTTDPSGPPVGVIPLTDGYWILVLLTIALVVCKLRRDNASRSKRRN